MSTKGTSRYYSISTCDTKAVRGFYTILEHPKRRQEWIEAFKFSSESQKVHYICCKHFKNSDFKIDYENLSTCRFPPLYPTAVPSFFLSTSVTLSGNESFLPIQDSCSYDKTEGI